MGCIEQELELGVLSLADLLPSKAPTLFPTAEHWMMACKALLFNDQDIFAQVISTTGTLKTIKSLGRKVSNFDEEVWVAARYQIVIEGNLCKFRESRNKGLRERLLGTGERMIVEASPLDRIWGVGFGEKRALSVKQSWGLNLLGRSLERRIALTRVYTFMKSEGRWDDPKAYTAYEILRVHLAWTLCDNLITNECLRYIRMEAIRAKLHRRT